MYEVYKDKSRMTYTICFVQTGSI